ncbi:Uncharacterized protein TCM_016625 [Theobroma cacao]|uniref:RNase H type-1 domain-containing protein n=1 Tax=Theobroma cacao TaxID=3641 RepID=A0A061G7Y6_THECC|nr:Uncharacterized protein TCM_016625 [Theobroma cacao]
MLSEIVVSQESCGYKSNRLGLERTFQNLCLKEWVLVNMSNYTMVDNIPLAVLFVYTLWFIWYWRNLTIFNASFSWPYNDWQPISWDTMRRAQSRMKSEIMISWEKRNHSFVKLNVDGSAQGQSGLAAAGGLIMDEYGHWIVGFTYKIGITFSLTTELWAMYHGLKLC